MKRKPTRSRWLREARRVVADVIAASPHYDAARDGDADALKAFRRELSAAYPFGRRENHPYRQWLVAQREAIAKMLPADDAPVDDIDFGLWRGKLNAKLTDADIVTIFERYAAGESQINIAIDFRVSQRNISKILKRETWQHVEIPAGILSALK